MGIKKSAILQRLKVALAMQQKAVTENKDIRLINRYNRRVRHLVALFEKLQANHPDTEFAFDE